MVPYQMEYREFSHRTRPAMFTDWILGFNQYRLYLTVRASTDMQLDGFVTFCLLRHAIFPYGFRFQVGLIAQEVI